MVELKKWFFLVEVALNVATLVILPILVQNPKDYATTVSNLDMRLINVLNPGPLKPSNVILAVALDIFRLTALPATFVLTVGRMVAATIVVVSATWLVVVETIVVVTEVVIIDIIIIIRLFVTIVAGLITLLKIVKLPE